MARKKEFISTGNGYWVQSANGTLTQVITQAGTVVGASGGVVTWDSLYDLDQALVIDGATLTFAGSHATNDVITITGTGTTGDLIQFSNSGTGSDIKGTSNTWSVSKDGAAVFTSMTAKSIASGTNLALDGTGTGTITLAGTSTGAVTIGSTLVVTGAGGSDALTVTAGDVNWGDASLTMVDADNATSLSLTNNTITTADLATITSTSLTTGNGVLVTTNGLTSGNMVSLVTTASGFTTGTFINCNDGSARFQVKADGATAITTGVNSTKALEITGIQTSENLVTLTSSGVTADNKAIVLVNSSGNSASGSNQIRIAPTGTPVEGSIGLEFVGASKVMQAMNIDGDSVNNSVVLINGGGAIAAGKATLEVTADGTPAAATSAVARFAFSGTDTNHPDVIYATTSGTGNIIEAVNTNAGAVGAVIKLAHQSASAANSDVVGRILFNGYDNTAETPVDTNYAKIDVMVTDITDTSEDGDMLFYVMRAGTVTKTLQLDSDVNGVVVGDGAATGIIQSSGNYDLTIQTGNATSSKITITDGANGNIALITDNTGVVQIGDTDAAGTITSSGAYDLTVSTNSTAANEPRIVLTDGAAGDITVTAGGTSGEIVLASPVVMSSTSTAGTADEAISVTTSITELSSDADNTAHVLGDGVEGQIKFIVMKAKTTGNCVVTPTNLAGTATTLTFDTVGDACTLLFTNGEWYVVGNNGVDIA